MTAWKQVTDFPMYEVSEDGRVRSQYRTKKQLAPGITSRGYCSVVLCGNGPKKNKLVHRLVAEAFLPRILGAPEVNHKNGVKTDNRVENLEWCTHSHNERHSYRVNGKKPSITNRKLEPDQVRAIRADTRRQCDIAREYGLDQSIVSYIRSGRNWRDLV